MIEVMNYIDLMNNHSIIVETSNDLIHQNKNYSSKCFNDLFGWGFPYFINIRILPCVFHFTNTLHNNQGPIT